MQASLLDAWKSFEYTSGFKVLFCFFFLSSDLLNIFLKHLRYWEDMRLPAIVAYTEP